MVLAGQRAVLADRQAPARDGRRDRQRVALQHAEARPPMTWEAIKRSEVTDGPRLHRLLNPKDPTWRGRFGRNVDKVFLRGRQVAPPWGADGLHHFARPASIDSAGTSDNHRGVNNALSASSIGARPHSGPLSCSLPHRPPRHRNTLSVASLVCAPSLREYAKTAAAIHAVRVLPSAQPGWSTSCRR